VRRVERAGRGVSLRTRAVLLLLVLIVVVGGSGVATALATSRAQTSDELLVRTLLPAADAVDDIGDDLGDEQASVRAFIVSGDPRSRAAATAAGELADAAVTTVRGYAPAVGGLAAALDDLAERRASFRAAFTEPELAARAVGDTATVARLNGLVSTTGAFTDVRAAVTRIGRLLRQRRDRALQRSEDAHRLQREVQVALLVLLVLTLTGLVLAVTRWVLAPVERLQHAFRRVSGGDLDAPVTVSGPPEMVALGLDAEAMRRRIVAELEESRSARQALEQRGPVVAGLREQLRASPLPVLPGLSVSGSLHAAEGVLAGDWWDAVPLRGGALAVVVCDVSGHGAEAGLVAARIKQSVTIALRLGAGPSAALSLAAQDLSREEERFASAFLAVVDPAARTVRWASGGHPPALLVLPGRLLVARLEPTGPLLLGGVGLAADAWGEQEVTMPPGSQLLMCTDGLLEVRDAEGAELGTDGVLATLLSVPVDADTDEVVAACLDAARAFGDWRRDDVTCVAVEMEAAGPVTPVAPPPASVG